MPSPQLSPARAATVALLSLRVAYGLGLVAAPAKLAAKRWLGPAAEQPPTQVALRGMGARETILHGAAIAAALRGAPLRPWLLASIAGDLTDVAATVAGRSGLPANAAVATAAVAGGSALLSAGAAALVDA